jgi:hypothetical protein
LIVSIHQPAYIPWLGYFTRIAASDAFIFLDNVQFEKNSFTNRNRIKTADGPRWLTVPVLLDDHFETVINEIKIDDRQNWRRKHLRSIEHNYRRASGFTEKFANLATNYARQSDRLAELCYNQLKFWLNELKIHTCILRASELSASGNKSALLLALCKQVGATTYLSGPLGRGYLQQDQFAANGIRVRYHDFVHPKYPQLFGDFLPAMGVVDFWMNCTDTDLIRGYG